jgi:hypothetical protein
MKWTPSAPPTTSQPAKNSMTSSAEADQGRPRAFTYFPSSLLIVPRLFPTLSFKGLKEGTEKLKQIFISVKWSKMLRSRFNRKADKTMLEQDLKTM